MDEIEYGVFCILSILNGNEVEVLARSILSKYQIRSRGVLSEWNVRLSSAE